MPRRCGRGRQQARIASSSPTVGAAATSCSATEPRPPGLAKRMAAKTEAASASSRSLSTSRSRSRRLPSPGSSAAAASGAHSNRMPRLVLQPAAAIEASTARKDARADLHAGCRDERRRCDGAGLELGDLHAVAAGVDVDVAGLECVVARRGRRRGTVRRFAPALRPGMVCCGWARAADARRRRAGSPRRWLRRCRRRRHFAARARRDCCSPRARAADRRGCG